MAENYREYGREVIDGELVINGKLTVADGATLAGMPIADKVSAVPTGESATAGDNATAINAIITALQSAGLMKSAT